jgi:hypothetical protein
MIFIYIINVNIPNIYINKCHVFVTGHKYSKIAITAVPTRATEYYTIKADDQK